MEEKKSIWEKFKDMLDTGSYPDGTKDRVLPKRKREMMILPDFEDQAVIKKLISGINGYNYNDSDEIRNRETYQDRVRKIVNSYFDNYTKVKVEGNSDYSLKYKAFNIRINDSYTSLCKVNVEIDGEKFSLGMSKYEIARCIFLAEFIKEQGIKARDAKLDDMLGVDGTEFTSKKLKGGNIRITEEEILDSLLQTHPQYFI